MKFPCRSYDEISSNIVDEYLVKSKSIIPGNGTCYTAACRQQHVYSTLAKAAAAFTCLTKRCIRLWIVCAGPLANAIIFLLSAPQK